MKRQPKINPQVEYLVGLGRELGLGEAMREFVFARPRQFRADLAWPEFRLLVEFEGGVYIRGRHTRGRGYENDCYKYSLASILGYTLVRVTSGMINDGKAFKLLKLAAERKLKCMET